MAFRNVKRTLFNQNCHEDSFKILLETLDLILFELIAFLRKLFKKNIENVPFYFYFFSNT